MDFAALTRRTAKKKSARLAIALAMRIRSTHALKNARVVSMNTKEESAAVAAVHNF